MRFSTEDVTGGPRVCEIKTEKKGGSAMTNVDYCGIVNLLRQRVAKDLLT